MVQKSVPMDFNGPEVSSSSAVGTNLEDSFVEDKTCDQDVDHSMSLNTSRRLNRMLDFQAYMSVSRCSTSPEPFLLQTVQADHLSKDDSICDQSMSSDHCMLNNTLEQLNMSKEANTSVCKENKLANSIDDYDDLCEIRSKTSHNDTMDFESDNIHDSVTIGSECSSTDSKQSAQQTDGSSKEVRHPVEQVELNSIVFASVTGSCILDDDQPQFTSSPKVEAKVNVTSNKQRSADDSRHLKACLETIEDSGKNEVRGKNSLESVSDISRSHSNISIPTTSNSNFTTITKWYDEENMSMYQSDTVPLKGGCDMPDKPSNSTVIDSDTSVIACTLNCGKQMTEGLDAMASLKSDESIRETKLLCVDLSNIERGKPSSCDKNNSDTESRNTRSINITENLTKEQQTDIKCISDKLELLSLCDTGSDLKDLQLVLKSKSHYNLVVDRNSEMSESKSELSENVSYKASSCSCPTSLISGENMGMPPVLKDFESVDRIADAYRYAENISDVETESLVSCACNEDTNDVQSTSVLRSEEELAACNLQNGESRCKDETLPSTLKLVVSTDTKPASPEALETPPNSWSPEIMDSGYPNSASAPDMTPEYDLSSIAQDHISDSDSPSIAEAPMFGVLEVIEVENADLANNNRDWEDNNIIAMELNDLEDLQPLIDVLENDLENENDIYALENGFPIWLLRILEMANPVDIDIPVNRELGPPDIAPGVDARYVNVDHDEGFDSSSSDDDSDLENEDNSDVNENAVVANIENDNENASNSDTGSDEWAASDT